MVSNKCFDFIIANVTLQNEEMLGANGTNNKMRLLPKDITSAKPFGSFLPSSGVSDYTEVVSLLIEYA